LKHTKH